jgi:type IV fimbrial biogenesis protein FimT
VDRILPGPGCHGLTLIELMITLAIVGVALVVGAPSLQRVVSANQLRAEAGRLLGAINLARSEAILRNVPVSLCPSSMATTGSTACSGEYLGGWIVYSNWDRDRVVDAGADELIRAFVPVAPGYRLTNRAGTRGVSELITYLPDGSSRRNRTLLLCAPRERRVEPWSIVLNRVGRARVARGEGTCPLFPG